ncbi:MAG: Rab family GTPase [Candidatus Heimdallarchaeota archaeon]
MAKLIWKIVIIGDPAVGKTSIRRNYLGETTLKEYIYTIGADFATKRIRLSKKLSVQYQIFDLAGQQKFNKVRASFYNGTQAAILVYDITNKKSLENLPIWIKEAKRNSDGSLDTFIVVGNKIDLSEQKKTDDKLLEKFLKDLSKEMGHEILHINTSALTGENINLLFKRLTTILLKEASKDSPRIADLVKELIPKKPKTPIKVPPPPKVPEAKTKTTIESRLESRLKHFELEINHLKLELRDLHSDIDYLKEIILKFLHENKKILEELNIRTD